MWRDGQLLVVRIGESFPDRCIKSNLPADGNQVEQVVESGGEWGLLAYVLSPLFGELIGALARRRVQFFVGLSDKWKRKRRRAYFVAGGIIALSIASALWGIHLMQRGGRLESLVIWTMVFG